MKGLAFAFAVISSFTALAADVSATADLNRETWRVLSSDFLPADESKIAPLSDGSWYVNARIGGRELFRAVHVSRDDGKTWRTVETLTAGPAAYSDLVDTADGRLLLVWEDENGSILCRVGAR